MSFRLLYLPVIAPFCGFRCCSATLRNKLIWPGIANEEVVYIDAVPHDAGASLRSGMRSLLDTGWERDSY